MNSISKRPLAEIQYQAKLSVHQSQVGQDLGFEDRVVLACGLALDNYTIVDKQINAQGCREPAAFVDDWTLKLAMDLVTSLPKLPGQRFFVYAFEQTWSTEASVDFDT